MNINNAFRSRYLKAADLEGGEFTVSISKVGLMEVGDDEKAVIYFSESDKGLVLNKTNALKIASAYSDETDSWLGHAIVLYTTKVPYQGNSVDGIRVRIPSSPSDSSRDAELGGDFGSGHVDGIEVSGNARAMPF
jgi:hypothetical protein